MNLNDEELQSRIERGEIGDDADSRAYQHVFTALNKDTLPELPSGFADKVIQRAMALNQKRESSKDLWWFGLGIFMLVICFAVALAFVDFEKIGKINLSFLKSILQYKSILVVAAVLVIGFNWLEKRLLKRDENVA